jgi:ABC-type phosphate transport system substrate-binding protein
MLGTCIKIVVAQQARIYNNNNNTMLKLLKMNSAISYNKICKTKQLTPKYIHVKINGNNMHSKNNKIAATKYRLNQEIRFLYCKKQKLNEKLYKMHLECEN